MMSADEKPLKSIEAIKPEDIRNYAIVLDIDGVVCEPQRPIDPDMAKVINLIHYKNNGHVYYCTGNTYTKAVDLVGGGKIFCNGADELREDGRLLWRDEVTPPLPDLKLNSYANNSVEWRSPRFVNYSMIGRYAATEDRINHDGSWRSQFEMWLKENHPDVESSIGGQISVDIYSKGADKSRAGKFLNDLGKPFIFIGDKTEPGGNDYPLVEYCNANREFNNIALTTTGPGQTREILDKIYRML